MGDYRYVLLLKNQLYPTYQLFAQMVSKETAPEDGPRLAALTCLEWLCRRLGDDVPEALQSIPAPAGYKNAAGFQLPSLHIHSGFVVDVVSLPENGIWSMQITEPDLGSDPGKLRVGSAPENLLRICFLHDDEKRLIVIGSLPRHLRAVTVKA